MVYVTRMLLQNLTDTTPQYSATRAGTAGFSRQVGSLKAAC